MTMIERNLSAAIGTWSESGFAGAGGASVRPSYFNRVLQPQNKLCRKN